MIIEEPVGGVKGTYGMVGVLEKGYGDVKFIAKEKADTQVLRRRTHRLSDLENS